MQYDLHTITEAEQLAIEKGLKLKDVLLGYIVSEVDSVELIQKIDDLDGTAFERFITDTEAGQQAKEDGIDVLLVNHGYYNGWYILNNPENINRLLRETLEYEGFLVEMKK